VAADKQPAAGDSAQSRGSRSNAFPIERRITGPWRPTSPRLPEGQVEPKYSESSSGEFVGHRYQKRRLAVRPGAMRQRDGMAGRALRTM